MQMCQFYVYKSGHQHMINIVRYGLDMRCCMLIYVQNRQCIPAAVLHFSSMSYPSRHDPRSDAIQLRKEISRELIELKVHTNLVLRVFHIYNLFQYNVY